MKHVKQISNQYSLPALAEQKYDPSVLPLGYIEGIISGGGSIFEVARAIVFDRTAGLVKKVL